MSMEKELQSKFSTRQHMLSKDYEIYYYNEHDTSRVESHTHDYYEFYFFLEGDMSIVIEDVPYPLKYGDMVVIPPNTKHHRIIRDKKIPYRRFVLWVGEEYYRQLVQQSKAYTYLMTRVSEKGDYVFNNDFVTFNAIQFQIFRLIEEIKFERFGKEARIPLCVNELLLELNRIVYEREHPKHTGEQKGLCQNVMYYIEEHLGDDLSLEKMSEVFFVSKYHIAHTFKDQMGLSMHQYILKKRLQACKEAILSGENITQIYMNYGFMDYSSFYRAFKKECGISPKEYRELYLPGAGLIL